MEPVPRVAIATISRFHSFELARQMAQQGALAGIYTGFARWVVRDTGVDPKMIRSFPWLQTTIEGLQKLNLLPRVLHRDLSWWAHETLDRHVARNLVPCHVFTALSGSGLHAGRVAQARGAAYVCDRASSHIRYQDEILGEEYARVGLDYRPIDPRKVAKECAEYESADAITVPSTFVRNSFIAKDVDPKKVHLVPFGVDLSTFYRRVEPDPEFRVLFVGQLSVRKGIHYLLQAFKKADLPNSRLVLVGSPQPEIDYLLDRFPVAGIERTGPLPREQVAEQMSRASVFVLASVEEGMAYVQAQALACGCPVIATAHTGGEDLFTDGQEGYIVPIRDPDAIAERLTRLYENADLRAQMSAAATRHVRSFGGWDDYGARSLQLFTDLAKARGFRGAD